MQGASPLASPGAGWGAALARPAPGERTISNAEVPLPRSPLSLATGTANRTAVLSVLHRTAGSHAQGTCLARSVSAAGGLMPGCRGRSPRRNKLWDSPFPAGRGSGGWGQKQRERQGRRARRKASPPQGFCLGRVCKCRLRLSPGDARGEAPCIKITLVSPFPTEEGGWGDGGKNNAKGRVGGRGERQAPLRVRNGRGGRRPPAPPPETAPAESAGGKEGKPPSSAESRKKRGNPA